MEIYYLISLKYLPHGSGYDHTNIPLVATRSISCDSFGEVARIIRDLTRAIYEIDGNQYGLMDLTGFKVERIQKSDVTERIKKACGLAGWEPR